MKSAELDRVLITIQAPNPISRIKLHAFKTFMKLMKWQTISVDVLQKGISAEKVVKFGRYHAINRHEQK